MYSFHKASMDQVVGKPAKYITILREPASQFESLFYYEGFDEILKIKSQSRALDIFLSSPDHYYQRMRHRRKHRPSIFHLLRNGMLFDLGFSSSDDVGPSSRRRSRSIRHRRKGFSITDASKRLLGAPNFVNKEYATPYTQSIGEQSGVLISPSSREVISDDQRSKSKRSTDSESHRESSKLSDVSGILNVKSEISSNEQQNKYHRNAERQSINTVSSSDPEKEDVERQHSIDKAIRSIEHDFDLVLLAEYFDESLVLLKKELCWSFNDLIYFKQNVRSQRKPISPKNAERIRNWNSGDLKLYKHFNETFWRKVKEYGLEEFTRDLTEFREINRGITEQCSFRSNRQDYISQSSTSRTDIKTYEAKGVDLDSSLKLLCEKMLVPEAEYILRFREKYHLNSTKIHNDD